MNEFKRITCSPYTSYRKSTNYGTIGRVLKIKPTRTEKSSLMQFAVGIPPCFIVDYIRKNIQSNPVTRTNVYDPQANYKDKDGNQIFIISMFSMPMLGIEFGLFLRKPVSRLARQWFGHNSTRDVFCNVVLTNETILTSWFHDHVEGGQYYRPNMEDERLNEIETEDNANETNLYDETQAQASPYIPIFSQKGMRFTIQSFSKVNPTTKRYPCPACKQLFTCKLLGNHTLGDNHGPNWKAFMCMLCEKPFEQYDTCFKHIQYHCVLNPDNDREQTFAKVGILVPVIENDDSQEFDSDNDMIRDIDINGEVINKLGSSQRIKYSRKKKETKNSDYHYY